MDVLLEVERRATALAKRMKAQGHYTRERFRAALKTELADLRTAFERAFMADLVNETADEILRELCADREGDTLETKHAEINRLRSFWGPGVKKAQAVEAYLATNPDGVGRDVFNLEGTYRLGGGRFVAKGRALLRHAEESLAIDERQLEAAMRAEADEAP